eukprot:9670458-Ditylum_brightwellii.AAC.1
MSATPLAHGTQPDDEYDEQFALNDNMKEPTEEFEDDSGIDTSQEQGGKRKAAANPAQASKATNTE